MKKQIIVIGIIISLIFVGFSGCTEQEEKNNPLTGLGFVNEEYGYGYNPPEGWYSEPLGLVLFHSPFEFDRFSYNTNNVTFHVIPGLIDDYTMTLGEPFTFEKIIEYYDELDTNNDQVNITSKEEFLFKGKNALKLIISGKGQRTISDEFEEPIKENYTAISKQIMILNGETVFDIYYIADENLYDVYEAVVNETIESFAMI